MRLALVLLILVQFSWARELKVRLNQVTLTAVTLSKKAPISTRTIACLKKRTAGDARIKGSRARFTSFKDQRIALTAQLGRASPKQRKSIQKKLSLATKLERLGKKACKTATAPLTDNPTNKKQEFHSLARYKGTFGPIEAKILYNRFGFGGTQSQINDAVASGLEATVNKLLTPVSEPALENQISDMTCDTWLIDDPDAGSSNRTCDPTLVNDFSTTGFRQGVIHRFVHSQNPFFQKFAFFLMDERLATSYRVLDSCERHALKSYLNIVYQAAYSGNYLQYMRGLNNDHLMHFKWLDGGTNRGGIGNSPNENWAREFWELGTVGPTGLDGKPVYSDLDVAQAALAFTGWDITGQTINGEWTCLAGFVPLLHTSGPKRVFAGTPYQAIVSSAEDLLQATFRHPRTAEHLAEDIWKEFINPFATPAEILELAAIIRAHNYNLIPVMKQVMMSKAVFAQKSRGSLLKHPIELFIGLVKTTGFPFYYRSYNSLLNRLEQKAFDPDTVFGWDVRYLAGEQLQVEWWKVIIDYFINRDIEELFEEYNFSYYDRFIRTLYNQGQGTSESVIQRVTQEFGLELNAAQLGQLNQLMNYYLTTSGCPSQCGGLSYRLVRDQFDSHPESDESGFEWNGQRKIRSLIAAITELPEYRVK